MADEEGCNEIEHQLDCGSPAEDPPGLDVPDDITAMRELAASLTGRLADVYEALLIQHAGGREKITMSSIARKWGVCECQ
jgi:hypothetical protein